MVSLLYLDVGTLLSCSIAVSPGSGDSSIARWPRTQPAIEKVAKQLEKAVTTKPVVVGDKVLVPSYLRYLEGCIAGC